MHKPLEQDRQWIGRAPDRARSATFGHEFPASPISGPRGIIAPPMTTPDRHQVAVKLGEENEVGSGIWHQVAYAVLTQAEAVELAWSLMDAAGWKGAGS